MNKKKEQIIEPKNAHIAKYDTLVVTDVTIFPFKETTFGHIKALVCIVLNDQFVIRGLRVMDGANGLYVGYPNDPFYKGDEFRTICNPLTRNLRETIENAVLTKYQEVVA